MKKNLKPFRKKIRKPKPTYQEYLKMPHWVQTRNRILQRDNHTCRVCQCKENLHVHHLFYMSGYKPPWSYNDLVFITLCSDCHKKWHEEHELIILSKRKYNELVHSKDKNWAIWYMLRTNEKKAKREIPISLDRNNEKFDKIFNKIIQ